MAVAVQSHGHVVGCDGLWLRMTDRIGFDLTIDHGIEIPRADSGRRDGFVFRPKDGVTLTVWHWIIRLVRAVELGELARLGRARGLWWAGDRTAQRLCRARSRLHRLLGLWGLFG